jgi:hypothetical protein
MGGEILLNKIRSSLLSVRFPVFAASFTGRLSELTWMHEATQWNAVDEYAGKMIGRLLKVTRRMR